MTKRYLSRPEAAAYLGVSLSYLAHLSPQEGPPVIDLPGGRRKLYDTVDLDAWMAALKRKPSTPGPEPVPARVPSVAPCRPGRPTKAEQIARRRKTAGRP